MPFSRRSLLLSGAAGIGVALAGCATAPAPPTSSSSAAPPGSPSREIPAIAALERTYGRTIGVHALDTGTGATVGHRDGDRFLMCSVVKSLMAGFVLHRAADDPALLDRRVHYERSDLLKYAPITSRNVATGMTVAQLCHAAVTVSDNTAHNLLLREVGSPADLTAWLRGLGDQVTRADRKEPDLNDRSGDLDTTTPARLAQTLALLTTGGALSPAHRERLLGWLRANTTGDRQIRAGVPAGWQVGDKTGSGPLGERNDAGILFPPAGGAPVLLSVLTVPRDPDDERGEAAIAGATTAALAAVRP